MFTCQMWTEIYAILTKSMAVVAGDMGRRARRFNPKTELYLEIKITLS